MAGQGGKSPLRALQRVIMPGSFARHERQRQEAEATKIIASVVKDVERERSHKQRLTRRQKRGHVQTRRRDGRKFTKPPMGKVKKHRRVRAKMAAASRKRNRA